MKEPKKSKIEPIHVEEAAKLKALYDARRPHKMSQADFGATFEIGTQGIVWQYLNARSPLNLTAALKFAKGLQCAVGEFSPRLAKELPTPEGRAIRDVDHEAADMATGLSPSTDAERQPAGAPSLPGREDDGMRKTGNLAVIHAAREEFITIKQFDAAGSMGHGLVLSDQPGVIQRWTVSPEWLHKNVRQYSAAGNLCIVTGFGPSMRPMFNPGDPLLCDTGIKTVVDGIYFFRIGDEGFIKQLQKIPTAGGMIYRAKSANPEYDPFDITPDMDFEILGKIVRVWCGTDF